MAALQVLLCLLALAAAERGSTVCIYNDAGFVMRWKLRAENGTETAETKDYPILQSRCHELAELGLPVNVSAVPVVKAVWGKELAFEPVEYDAVDAVQVTYVCRGTTLDYHCVQEQPPPPAAEVAKHVGEFLLGFTEGLGEELGFAKCLSDVNQTFQDLADVVGFFENGINKKLPAYVVRAFERIGKLLKDFAAAVKECVQDATAFAKKFEDLAGALSGNVLDILKIFVEEGVHIWRERKDLTADCKAVAADWQAGDFEGSGHAVGDIVGILLSGLDKIMEEIGHVELV